MADKSDIAVGGSGAFNSSSNSFLNTQRASGMAEIGTNMGALAVTTTNIDVFSNGHRVGFIQSASPSESRNINKIMELGTEGIVQSVPSNTNGGSLSVNRIAIYNSSLFNALGMTKTGQFLNLSDNNSNRNVLSGDKYKTFSNVFKTLKDQRVPLEIQIKTKMPALNSVEGAGNRFLVDTYVDCWLSSYSKSIASGTITITETANISYSEVYTTVIDG
jgi:hypothetical protein